MAEQEQKHNTSLRELMSGVFGCTSAGSFMAVFGVLVFQAGAWLRTGEWPTIRFVYLLLKIGVMSVDGQVTAWLAADQWVGVQKIVASFLDMNAAGAFFWIGLFFGLLWTMVLP